MNATIHVKSYGEAEKVLEKLHELGYKWRYGPTTKERLYWYDNKEATTYEIENGYIVVSHIGSRNPRNEVVDAVTFLKDKKWLSHIRSQTAKSMI